MCIMYYNSLGILMPPRPFVTQPAAQPIDSVDGWLHLSIARASSALRSVCAAILN